MLWLGVHFPELPLEIHGDASCRSGLQTAIDFKNRDLEIAPTGAATIPTVIIDNHSRVLLRNASAITAGIARGSTLATAHSIVPGLLHHRRDPAREIERLTLLAEALYGFSARVCLMPPAAPDDPTAGVVLEIGGSLKLFGDADVLARQAAELCRGMGHQIRVRWAKTPLAALALARSDARTLKRVHLREASVEPERLTTERIERFANMGVHTLGQLLALPRRGLARRFGEDLVDFLDRLTGERPDPRPFLQPADHFRVELHLLDPLGSKEALVFPMQRLLNDLRHWLVARQLGAEHLLWHFAGSSGRVCMPVRFARAQQSREAFLDITRLQLAETALPEDIISLTLEAHRLVPWATVSQSAGRGLFGNLPGLQSAEDTCDLGELVDQLRARLGPEACYILEVKDQHTPEQAFHRAQPLNHVRTASAEKSRREGTKQRLTTESPHPRKRPLWLFDPPRPVDPRQLVLLEGPERIHTGWWLTGRQHEASGGQARDYYVARHQGGAQCWVFTDPWDRWFLHGYF